MWVREHTRGGVPVVEFSPGDRIRAEFLRAVRIGFVPGSGNGTRGSTVPAYAYRFRLLEAVPRAYRNGDLDAGAEISVSATRFHAHYPRVGPGTIEVSEHRLRGGWTSARFVAVPIHQVRQDREAEELEAGD